MAVEQPCKKRTWINRTLWWFKLLQIVTTKCFLNVCTNCFLLLKKKTKKKRQRDNKGDTQKVKCSTKPFWYNHHGDYDDLFFTASRGAHLFQTWSNTRVDTSQPVQQKLQLIVYFSIFTENPVPALLQNTLIHNMCKLCIWTCHAMNTKCVEISTALQMDIHHDHHHHHRHYTSREELETCCIAEPISQL